MEFGLCFKYCWVYHRLLLPSSLHLILTNFSWGTFTCDTSLPSAVSWSWGSWSTCSAPCSREQPHRRVRTLRDAAGRSFSPISKKRKPLRSTGMEQIVKENKGCGIRWALVSPFVNHDFISFCMLILSLEMLWAHSQTWCQKALKSSHGLRSVF